MTNIKLNLVIKVLFLDVLILRFMCTSIYFSIFTKGYNFWNFLLLLLAKKKIQKGSTFKGKNLLLEEQILSFKS